MQYFKTIFGLVNAYRQQFFRDKTALFFTFLFPLIFLFVFGTIFGDNNSGVSFNAAVFNKSESVFAKDFTKTLKEQDTFNVNEEPSTVEEAQDMLSRGQIDTIIILPESFGVVNTERMRPTGKLQVFVQKGSEGGGQMVAAVLEKMMDNINRKMGQGEPYFTVEQKINAVEGAGNFDYTFAGLLGFTLMSMGIFSLANSMPQSKRSGELRRLRASPLKTSQLIFANATHYVAISLLSAVMMIIIGILVFDFSMRGNWLLYGAFIILSTVMVTGVGLLVGAWAKNEKQSAPLSNLVSFPMMFLSGAFFPTFLFPEWMESISNIVPLKPVIDGLRLIATENASLMSLLPQIGIIVVWMVVVYFLAIKLFRWQ